MFYLTNLDADYVSAFTLSSLPIPLVVVMLTMKCALQKLFTAFAPTRNIYLQNFLSNKTCPGVTIIHYLLNKMCQ